jgi:pimeloyl-ACP methyl ester carboxylesterase
MPCLQPHVTVHTMDRRGRGASGDGSDYDLAREFEDVAAMVDAVVEASGAAVDLLGVPGQDVGGGGAALTSNLRALVLYEGWPMTDPEDFPPGLEERLLLEGNREAVLESFMREVVALSEEKLSAFRAQPASQDRLAAAHTITREHRAERQGVFDAEQAARVTVPVLLLVGADSPLHLKPATS